MKPTLEQIQRIASAEVRTAAMKEEGVSPTTFYRYCRQYGIEYQNKRSSYVLSLEDDEHIAQLAAVGFTTRQLGEKYNVAHTTIIKRLNRRKKGILPRVASES